LLEVVLTLEGNHGGISTTTEVSQTPRLPLQNLQTKLRERSKFHITAGSSPTQIQQRQYFSSPDLVKQNLFSPSTPLRLLEFLFRHGLFPA
jgi:hypothetical protein